MALDGGKNDHTLPNNLRSPILLETTSRQLVRIVPFLCPHCHQSVDIDLHNFDEDWRKHFKADIKPYVCTFGNCTIPNQLYDSYEQWSDHERQFHRREWFCGLCSYICTSKDHFAQHVHNSHSADLPQDQQDAVLKLSERAMSSPQQRPFCVLPPISDPTCFQRHLGLHLEQMSNLILQDLTRGENSQPPIFNLSSNMPQQQMDFSFSTIRPPGPHDDYPMWDEPDPVFPSGSGSLQHSVPMHVYYPGQEYSHPAFDASSIYSQPTHIFSVS